MNLNLSSNDGQHNELVIGIAGSRLFLTVNETNFSFEELNHLKYDDQKRHDVIIDFDKNSMIVDKNELQDIPNLNLFRTLTVQLGDRNNGLGNLCLNNVSILGLRLLDVAYQSPNSSNLQFVRNRFGRQVEEAVCIDAEIATTPALSTTSPSTLSSSSTTSKFTVTTPSTSSSKSVTGSTTPARSTPRFPSTTRLATVLYVTDTVPSESQQATTITVVVSVFGILLILVVLASLYWYYIIRPKKKNDIELISINKNIPDGNSRVDQPAETIGLSDNNKIEANRPESFSVITERNSGYDNGNLAKDE